jgi:hypothetical protein
MPSEFPLAGEWEKFRNKEIRSRTVDLIYYKINWLDRYQAWNKKKRPAKFSDSHLFRIHHQNSISFDAI